MEIKALAEALSKAQGKITAPKKNKTAGFYDKKGQWREYCYADLADVLEAIKTPLSESALSITQTLGLDPNGGYGLKTTLHHPSGESLESWYPLPNPASDISPQAFGSELTYARRYSITALIMTAADEDDDGQKSDKANKEKPKQAPVASKTASPVTPKQQAAPVTNTKQTPAVPAQKKTLEAMTDEELSAFLAKVWPMKVMSNAEVYQKMLAAVAEAERRGHKIDRTTMPKLKEGVEPLQSGDFWDDAPGGTP